MNRRIDFIIAGVQKGGTTALHAVLSAHEQVFMPAEKELHFFDGNRAVDWRDPDYSSYERHFSRCLPSQICGEATPSYIYWPDAIERICAYNPAVRLVISLRDPILRAHSAWRMERSRGIEWLGFSEAIREGRLRLLTDPKAHRGHHKNLSYVERGFYGAQLERVYRHFPRNQVLVLLHDDLVENPERLLDRLARFLGIGTIDPAPLDVHHSPYPERTGSDPISSEDVDYLRTVYRDDFARLKEMIDDDLSRWSVG